MLRVQQALCVKRLFDAAQSSTAATAPLALIHGPVCLCCSLLFFCVLYYDLCHCCCCLLLCVVVVVVVVVVLFLFVSPVRASPQRSLQC